MREHAQVLRVPEVREPIVQAVALLDLIETADREYLSEEKLMESELYRYRRLPFTQALKGLR